MSASGKLRWLRRLVSTLLLLIVVTVSVVFTALQMSVNQPGENYLVDGVKLAVEIRFDQRQRPWVRAESLEDALLAEGWLHARYRLWQMELLRRAGRGRLAEGLGAGLLESDSDLWRAGVPQLAGRLEAEASTLMLEWVDAYLAGVNQAIENTLTRPPEFWMAGLQLRAWSRRDVFAVGAIIAFQSANNQDNELLRLALSAVLDEKQFSVFIPDESRIPGFPYILSGYPGRIDLTALDALNAFDQPMFPSASLGSSGWAVSPGRSASGNALFAFDSHDALNLPNLFYEVHLFYGPDSSIRGWSLPGLPGVINGFNQHLAWGMTNIGDTQDLFLETRDPADPGRFELDGAWYQARTEVVEIPVKGRDAPEKLTIIHTRNGPLISEDPPLSLSWTGHDLGGRGMEALIAMNVASDLESFSAALDQHGAPSANITYADRDGHIMFRTIGLIPERGRGRGLYPLNGNVSDNLWRGRVPNPDMPRAIDPPMGYVAAANSRVHDSKPLISADNAAGYRIGRLHSVLGSSTNFDLDDMQALQLDFYNTQAANLLPGMLPALRALDGEQDKVAFLVLQAWLQEPTDSADSAGALIWEHWYPELAGDVFGHEFDDELLARLMRRNYVVNHALDRLILQQPDSSWWRGDRDEILRNSFSRVVAFLSDTFGADPARWRWDQAHSVYFKHELAGAAPFLDSLLNRGPKPWGGGHPVLGRAGYRYDTPFTGRSGATVRVVAEMGPESGMKVRAIIPGGQNGNPASPWYDDQLESWLNGELDVLAESPEAVDGTTTRLIPRP